MNELFDNITRIVGSKMPRRRALIVIASGLVGSAVALIWPTQVEAEGLCRFRGDGIFRENLDTTRCNNAAGDTLCFCGRNEVCCPNPAVARLMTNCCRPGCCNQRTGQCIPRGQFRIEGYYRDHIDILVQHNGGLDSITVAEAVNCSVSIPNFPVGTTAPVEVTATKINLNQRSRVVLTACPVGVECCECCDNGDPVLAQLEIPETTIGNGQVRERFTALPQNESFVSIQNGDPGLKKLRIKVNGKTFETVRLRDNKEITFDVASEMVEGDNTIVLVGYGKPGAQALIMISDVPPSQTNAQGQSVQNHFQWQIGQHQPGQNLTWGR